MAWKCIAAIGLIVGLADLALAGNQSAGPLPLNAPALASQDPPPAPADQIWKMVWNDEFDGKALDPAKWTHRPDGPRREGWWSGKAVSLDGQGHLVLSALKDGNRILTGNLITAGKFEHRFGYFTCRVMFQTQPGFWPTFWLTCGGVMNADPNMGRDGTEIDIFEKPRLGNQIEHNLHWDGYGVSHRCAGHHEDVAGLAQGWHTIGLWWKPDEYVFYVDGKETWRTNAGGVSQVPEYILLSNEVGNWAGKIAAASLPDSLKIDYVRVYDLVKKPQIASSK